MSTQSAEAAELQIGGGFTLQNKDSGDQPSNGRIRKADAMMNETRQWPAVPRLGVGYVFDSVPGFFPHRFSVEGT